MSDRAGFYRVDDLISHGKDRSMSESCHDLSSAVDSRKLAVFLISAEFQRLLDHRGKVFLIIDMNHSNRMKLIPLLLGAMTGRKKRYKGTRTYECREVKIHTDAPLPVHVDGEVCGNVNDIQAECIPRKVRMMF